MTPNPAGWKRRGHGRVVQKKASVSRGGLTVGSRVLDFGLRVQCFPACLQLSLYCEVEMRDLPQAS